MTPTTTMKTTDIIEIKGTINPLAGEVEAWAYDYKAHTIFTDAIRKYWTIYQHSTFKSYTLRGTLDEAKAIIDYVQTSSGHQDGEWPVCQQYQEYIDDLRNRTFQAG